VFRSVLIANRGEIAVRVARACRDLGIESVAVFSDVDRWSPHVTEADRAFRIGPAAASESYLRGDTLIEVAKRAAAEAIHPGYGFLAERAEFAQMVNDAGLTWIGPRPDTIAAMGDKTEARKRMRAAGVPIVPGTVDAVADPRLAAEIARDIGFPVLLKAAAGGGGKGMRLVERAEDLDRAFQAAGREAESAFGDGSIYVEKYLSRPRHIEIQVLGDGHGSVLHLGERECSIQRRHQKLVEEAPSAVLTAEERERMGMAAVRAAEAVDYEGAGTVEFLYQGGEFYFLEMNTRLQVEHPVTELVTGLDLVEWQLRVAGGEALPFGQQDIQLRGHAIECRITSESVADGFLPSTGRVERLLVPGGMGVRWDGGVAIGSDIGLHYDPLLGKLIVHGSDRPSAIRRMRRALSELVIDGVDTTVALHQEIMEEDDFQTGRLTIRYLEEHPDVLTPASGEDRERAIAATAALLEHQRRDRVAPRSARSSDDRFTAWRAAALPWLHRS
jgi:acetyl-CoA carboxylase biotin carboxylase subunit